VAVLYASTSNGALVLNADGSFAYAPDPNWHGEDAFLYRACEAGDPATALCTNPATVRISVYPVNDAPVTNPDGPFTTAEDTPLSVPAPGLLANDTDVEGTSLLASLVSDPAHGTIQLGTDGSFTYTPNADYHGADAFSYRVCEPSGPCGQPVTIALVVTPVNDAPVANADTTATAEDTPVTLDPRANDADVDGDALAITGVTDGTHGTVTFTATSVTYTPEPNWHGVDAFSYFIADPSGVSASAIVSVTVAPAPDAPTAIDDEATTPEDTAITLNVLANDTDVDGDPLVIESYTQPASGVVAQVGNALVFTPAPNASGTVTFTYTAADPSGLTSSATVTMNVTPVNDPPIAQDVAATVDEDASVGVALQASDIDSTALTFTLVTPPQHGSVTISGDLASYTPDPNYNGPDSFSYRANDGTDDSNVAVVTLTVRPINDAPTAQDDSATTPEDMPVDISVLGNDSDIDGDTLAVTDVGAPTNGTAFVKADGVTITYVPAANFAGSDTFTYTASDGEGATATATVTVTVTPVNDAPVARDDTITTDEDAPVLVAVLANDSDVDGDALAITSVTQPSHGTASVVGSQVLYTPNENFHGVDTFQYTISDSHSGAFTANVHVDVLPVNDAPVANPDDAATPAGAPIVINVLANDTDADGDVLAVSAVSTPAHGTAVVLLDGTVRYTPAAGFVGSDTFTYTARDPAGATSTATVRVSVTSLNRAPIACDAALTTPEDTALTISLVATDADGQPLTYAIASQPMHGTLSVLAGNIVTYTPDLNYHGLDSFTFTASDGALTSNVATVQLTVTPVNDPPVLAPVGNKTVAKHQTLTFTLSATDVDGDALTFYATGLPPGATLHPSTGAFSWSPSGCQHQTYTVTFCVRDRPTLSTPGVLTDCETVTLSVTTQPPSNAPPRCDRAYPSEMYIWPPNHKMRDVRVRGVTDPNGDPVTITVTRILQDEPTNTIGDGNTEVDGAGVGTAVAKVRAERTGSPRVPGDGRVYFIEFTASDGRGGTCSGTVTTCVPHDMGCRRGCVDSGVRYDSTVPNGPRL
jgi:hypothetical protein